MMQQSDKDRSSKVKQTVLTKEKKSEEPSHLYSSDTFQNNRQIAGHDTKNLKVHQQINDLLFSSYGASEEYQENFNSLSKEKVKNNSSKVRIWIP